jgi:hypothetical protein
MTVAACRFRWNAPGGPVRAHRSDSWRLCGSLVRMTVNSDIDGDLC